MKKLNTKNILLILACSLMFPLLSEAQTKPGGGGSSDGGSADDVSKSYDGSMYQAVDHNVGTGSSDYSQSYNPDSNLSNAQLPHPEYNETEDRLNYYYDFQSSEEVDLPDQTTIYRETYTANDKGAAAGAPANIVVYRDKDGNPVVDGDSHSTQGAVASLPAPPPPTKPPEKPAAPDCDKTPEAEGCSTPDKPPEDPCTKDPMADGCQPATDDAAPEDPEVIPGWDDSWGSGGTGGDSHLPVQLHPGDVQHSSGAAPWGKPSPFGGGVSGGNTSSPFPGHNPLGDPLSDIGMSGSGASGAPKGSPNGGSADPNPGENGNVKGMAEPGDLKKPLDIRDPVRERPTAQTNGAKVTTPMTAPKIGTQH